MADRTPHTIGAGTKIVGLLGHPVTHSRSPALQNAAFRAGNLDMVYVACDVLPPNLHAAVEGLRALGWVGANVTVPHKQEIVRLLDRVDPLAGRIKAVNTVVSREDGLVGYNTDIHGFLMALEQGWGRGPAGCRALVLGAGGAARAVVAALVTGGAEEVLVYNRTAERAIELCSDAAMWGTTRCRTVRGTELPEVTDAVHLMINATTVGLDPEVKVCPLAADTIREHHVIMDLVYGMEPTPLIAEARRRGARAFDGWEMLIQQAARSYELWTEMTAPIAAMRDQVMTS